ncbi:Fe2+-dependent dioxygenase [Sphingomonas morindae]|uniref:Fe2+-dependent dioxygenase n=1 Tax=Sphingomonas morindae TaxID=1541170 RepID=A0ABY4X7H7_9SPHN|nr:Fe2+-dependent dioxygenase [Sphingomonas morindae]USI72883.1 Fe2+-dependent dioxygenase [Sphingomonas morindae]
MIPIPSVLDPELVAGVRALVDAGEWVDGNATSGAQSAIAKRNRQLAEGSAAAVKAGSIVLDALGANATFVASALPAKVFPPLFSRYESGEAFGPHIDNAIRMRRGTDFRLRTDLSATLFLSEPDDYDGGELVIDDAFETRRVKLGAGSLILYPSSSVHHVAPVTRGVRVACVFWVQSMVRDGEARRHLLELDGAVQEVATRLGQADPAVVRLTGLYHNLLRRWADV